MNLFRKILFTLFCTLLFSAVWAQKSYPSLNSKLPPPKIDSLIKVYKAQKDLKGLGIVYELRGLYFQNIFFYGTKSVSNYFTSYQYYLKIEDEEAKNRVKKRIADLLSMDDVLYEDAAIYYHEVLGYYMKQDNKVKIASCKLELLNILINKDSLKNTQKLNKHFKYGIEKGLVETIQLCKNLKDNSYLAYGYYLYSSFYLQKRRLKEAQKYLNLSAGVSKPKTLLELRIFFQQGLIDKYNQNYLEAITHFKKSELLAEIRNNKYLQQHICQNLAECYIQLNNQEQALFYWEKTAKSINRFYNSEETKSTRKEPVYNQIELIKRTQELVFQKQLFWQVVAYFIIGILILGGIIAYQRIKFKQRQKDLVNQRKISMLELKSMKSLIEGQEKERNRVAKDLHDGLGANLSSIKLFIESQRDKHAPEIQAQLLNPLAKNIDDACLETRSISHDLRPFSLKYGFNSALGDLVKKAQTALPQTEVIFDSYGEEPQISEEIALMVYRIVQELLNNAAKYAKATQITLQIFYEPDQLSVHVEDDGEGFDLQKVKEGNGLGNIRSRVDYLGGQVIWQAAPQQGTAVILSVPLQNPAKNLG